MDFNEELKKLNPKQREAVEAIEGPVMVVAGPGTGKTQILTLRIANILQKTDTPPESILALTFTESAVVSMKKRLAEVAGVVAGKVSIKTIHGFCNEVIQENPEAFPQIAGGSNVSDVEQIQIIRELLDAEQFTILRSFGDPYRSVRDILGAISELKREGKSPADFAKLVQEEQKEFDDTPDLYNEKGAYKGQMKGKYQTEQKRIHKHQEFVALYEAYQQTLLKTRRYDYDDMILAVAQVLRKDRDLRFILQEKYLYILVDEHQDTNQSQNEVIELLASFHENPNLFVVGDAKQAIYRFQGASLENFTYFKEKFKGAKVIALTENYRSTQTILDAALDIALGADPLQARAGHPEQHIYKAICSSTLLEPYVIARHIQARIEGGVSPEKIAVLYRNNKDSEPIARHLAKLGVPYAISADDDALADPGVKKLILLLEAVQNFGKDYALLPVLYLDISRVAPLDVALLINAARETRVSVFQLVRDRETLKRIIPESAETVFALYEKMSLWRAMSKSFSLLPMFESIVRESGLLASLIAQPDGALALAKVNAVYGELKDLIVRKRTATLDDFLLQLEIMIQHHVRIKSSVSSSQSATVHLMTAHKSKGMEFEYVYLMGATENRWEGKRDRDFIKLPASVFSRPVIASTRSNPEPEEDDNSDVSAGASAEEDERNLFFVALTRAKKELVISYSTTNDEGSAQEPSVFLTSIRPELIRELEAIPTYEEEFAAHPELEYAAMPTARTVPLKEAEFLRQRFLDRGLSVSALNNYLECPSKFYFLNLVGMQEAPNPSAQAGNAAHGALKYAVEAVGRGEPITVDKFLDRFAYLLSREPMREADFKAAIQKGERALTAYFKEFSKTWNAAMRPEFPVEATFRVSDSVEIPLRGRFDRIDVLSDIAVRVVDYKFKKPMSRNEIAGLTKSSDGNYYRQLTFYKLLIDEGTSWKMKEASLDFLEPSSAKASEGQARPKFKQEIFAPSNEEVAELKKEITRVVNEVLDLKFWEKGCGERDCKYCELKSFI